MMRDLSLFPGLGRVLAHSELHDDPFIGSQYQRAVYALANLVGMTVQEDRAPSSAIGTGVAEA